MSHCKGRLNVNDRFTIMLQAGMVCERGKVLYSLTSSGKLNQTLEESAREYQAKHENKTELKEVKRITGEEEESNVLQVHVYVCDMLYGLIYRSVVSRFFYLYFWAAACLYLGPHPLYTHMPWASCHQPPTHIHREWKNFFVSINFDSPVTSLWIFPPATKGGHNTTHSGNHCCRWTTVSPIYTQGESKTLARFLLILLQSVCRKKRWSAETLEQRLWKFPLAECHFYNKCTLLWYVGFRGFLKKQRMNILMNLLLT